MQKIFEEKYNRRVQEKFDYSFMAEKEGLYLMEISARAQSAKQIGAKATDDDDLRIEIDGRRFPKLDNPQRYADSPATFSGGQLHGLSKTVYFLINLSAGRHQLTFIPDQYPLLEKLAIYFFGDKIAKVNLELNQQAEDGDRRPWLTFVLVDLPLKSITAKVTARWRWQDSDDVKLIIDGQTQKNNLSLFYRNWLWSGSIFKKLFQNETQTKTIKVNLSSGLHYLEFWADRLPTLHQVELDLGKISSPKLKYNDPPKIAEGFNKSYVLKDEAFNDKDSMSEQEIQEFLNNYHEVKEKNHLSKLTFDDKSAAYWIKKAAQEYAINPKLLLAKLQAEQRLIKGSKAVEPTKDQLNGAMGVGMYEGKIIEELQGFVIQITSAAKYFREYYNEAEAVNFIHKNVDDQKLKAVNAATYSLYKYTPHLAGPKLVHDVYKGFFGTDNLGGILSGNDSGGISLKILFFSALAILLLLTGFIYFFSQKNKPIYSWQNIISLGDNLELIAKLQIFSQKEATFEDGLYCGFRFYKIYDSKAKLLLSRHNKILDSIDLTNPELVMPVLSSRYLTNYQPWDINGDGKKQEFVIQEYAGCNGNLFSFIRVNKDLNKFEKIPVIHQDQFKNFVFYVAHGNEDFKLENGLVKVRYYDNTRGQWFRDWYEYDKKEEVLKWVKGGVALVSE